MRPCAFGKEVRRFVREVIFNLSKSKKEGER
jgi:hypothetical protein